jgi:uncharacterized protein YdhG (YjbR/CyaY superfamily)
MEKFATVDAYISSFSADVQEILQKLRTVIRKAAPQGEESMSYGMPGYKLNGRLVYFAAWKSHVGLYGAPSSAVEVFKDELTPYKMSKGTIQFPLDKPMPYALIEKIVKYRVKENLAKG